MANDKGVAVALEPAGGNTPAGIGVLQGDVPADVHGDHHLHDVGVAHVLVGIGDITPTVDYVELALEACLLDREEPIPEGVGDIPLAEFSDTPLRGEGDGVQDLLKDALRGIHEDLGGSGDVYNTQPPGKLNGIPPIRGEG